LKPEEARYCIRCGSPLRMQFLHGARRPACSQCGWILFADPKVAAAILVEKDGEVLLVQRGIEPEQGHWGLPAGFIDAWEDPARAAERECQEETGLDVHVTALVDVIGGRDHLHGADIIIVYRAEIIGGALRAGDDASQVGFFSRQALPPLAFRATQLILSR
jgi:8-oxo-dGTP diphosphatase